MTSNVGYNQKEFEEALRLVQSVSRKSIADQLNQRGMNIAVRAFTSMPPQDVVAARKNVKRYMDEFVKFTRIKQNKSGKNKGKFRPLKKALQLRRKHLIAQFRAKKEGKKGLYGDEMKKASGKLSQMAQISQGFLKSVFLPVIVGFYPYVKFRPPVSLTRNVARWKGSAGDGKAIPAIPNVTQSGATMFSGIKMAVNPDPKEEGKVRALYETHFRAAIANETIEMRRHFENEFIKRLNKMAFARRA